MLILCKADDAEDARKSCSGLRGIINRRYGIAANYDTEKLMLELFDLKIQFLPPQAWKEYTVSYVGKAALTIPYNRVIMTGSKYTQEDCRLNTIFDIIGDRVANQS